MLQVSSPPVRPPALPLPSAAGRGQASVLVCAPRPGEDPAVVVADGSYESGRERVFWRERPDIEVLRIPLEAPVSQRPLHTHGADRLPSSGEQALLQAIQRHVATAVPRPRISTAAATPATTALEVAAASLRTALLAGDPVAACLHAELLRTAGSLAAVYDLVASTLHEVGQQWADGTGTVLAERRVSTTAHSVVHQLRQGAAATTADGCVILAAPAGDRHRLALEVLAHLIIASGRPALVVEDLPLSELTILAADPTVEALVVSAHQGLTPTQARHIVTAVRAAAPNVLIAVGGPGYDERIDGRGCGADVVTSSLDELLSALNRHRSDLTRRECEVLLAVAEGLTNHQIADQLGLSVATVKSHLDRVMAKTHTQHRSAAVARALREGWIT